MTEPFGYFRATPFGWEDCAETDEGAVPLYDQETVSAITSALDEMADAKSIDDRFGWRLAIMLECMILNPTRHYDEACRVLDEYKAEWDRVNPASPTFMGEPVITRKACHDTHSSA